MHDGSGVAEVWSNDKRISRTDLYSPGWESYYLRKTIGSVSIFNNLVMFAGVFLTVLFGRDGTVDCEFKKNDRNQKGSSIFYWILCCLICYFLLFSHLGFRNSMWFDIISHIGGWSKCA